jgi:RNA polymerase sigma-70 factor (ECF subfamily)
MTGAELERQIEELHPASFSWALACCRFDHHEAEDVLQTTYLKVMDGRARFAGRASVKTWLFAVIRTTAAERRRRAWLRRLSLRRWLDGGEEPAPPVLAEERVTDDERRRAVIAALTALPARQREVLDLVFYHDLTVEEAAAVMGVTLGTARIHYARGKARLLGLLGPRGAP